jgi:hypothetical protein
MKILLQLMPIVRISSPSATAGDAIKEKCTFIEVSCEEFDERLAGSREDYKKLGANFYSDIKKWKF